jgi:perosamine synthetase
MKINLMEPILTKEMLDAATKALQEEFFLRGESVKKFEMEFAHYIGVKHAVAVNSGTSALHLSLLSLGIGEGNLVITTPFTFIATANVITFVGARPLFVDISPNTFTIDPEELKKAIANYGEKVRAIIPVHLYGYPCKMNEITEIAREHDITIIEDACQAHGAIYKGKKVGSFGDAAAFSFYPSKNITVAGDGGMITTNNDEIAEIVSQLRDVGRAKDDPNRHDYIGYTARMNTVNAAIGRIQLKYLEEWNEKRRRIAKEYHSRLNGVGDLILPPEGDDNIRPAWHLYVIRTRYRNQLKEYLESKGIQCGIHYPIPIHLQPPYRKIGYSEGMFPNSEKCAKEVLSLPMHQNLSIDDINYITDAIKEFYRRVK